MSEPTSRFLRVEEACFEPFDCTFIADAGKERLGRKAQPFAVLNRCRCEDRADRHFRVLACPISTAMAQHGAEDAPERDVAILAIRVCGMNGDVLPQEQ